MFGNFFDWLWMALAVAVGMAVSRYIIPALVRGVKALASLADRVNKDDDDG